MIKLLKYADSIVNLLDKNNTYISHRLYRQHTTITNTGLVKDLSKLGRDLNKVIMIDNIAENFKLQPNNGFWIKTWNEDIKDTQLKDLNIILKKIYFIQPVDVRVIVKKIKDEVSKRLSRNLNISPYSNLDVN